MADFDPAVEFVLGHEGGFVVDQHDPGGATNFGISQRSYPSVKIEDLTRDQAKEIYRRDFWRFDGVKSQRVANKLLDLFVNMGPRGATCLVQETLKHFLSGPIVIDGVLGPQTLSAIDGVEEKPLVRELQARSALFHATLAFTRAEEKTFLLGWLRRDIDG